MTPTTLQAFIPKLTDLTVIKPEITIAAAAMLILLSMLPTGKAAKITAPWIAGLALAETFIPLIRTGFAHGTGFQGMMITDGFAVLVKSILAATGLLTIGISTRYIKRENLDHPEYYALMLFAISGMMLMASSSNLIMIFLSLEILSISLYILTGFAREAPRSQEAALKYFLLGAFASAFLLYGIALVYGSAGTISLKGIAEAIARKDMAQNPMLLVGVGLIGAGLAFKVAAVPFHMWTPDVYDGAPTPVAAFMSIGAKAAGFAALARVLLTAFPALKQDWVPALWAIAVLTMIIGNVIAVSQNNIKRLLAYSSIAHAGYILIGITSANEAGISAVVFYLAVYLFANLGAWAVVILVSRQEDAGIDLPSYNGLFYRNPTAAGAMAVFMFALAGLPPTGGFTAKFYIFSAAIQANMVGLVIFGVLTSLISVYYYFRVTVLMFMREPEEAGISTPAPLGAVMVITALITLTLGVLPGGLLKLAEAGKIVIPR